MGFVPVAVVLGSVLSLSIISAIVLLRTLTFAPVKPLPRQLRIRPHTATIILVSVVCGVLLLANTSLINAGVSALTVALAAAIWRPATIRWFPLTWLWWSSAVALSGSYLALLLLRALTRQNSVIEFAQLTLWALTAMAVFLALAYLWEVCDVLGSATWRRASWSTDSAGDQAPDSCLPFVSIHLPACDEPPHMVIASIRRLTELDYPNYEIIVLDDNTKDESVWRPVEKWCRGHDVRFFHLQDWPGHKAGALNFAVKQMDPRAELVGIIDSDCQVDSEFLRRCVPFFDDRHVGFVQAMQDYRDWELTRYHRWLYHAYLYFFAVTEPSRNERDAATFAGTVGLVRRNALESVGGWDEWCIAEDHELSVRLAQAGWSGRYVHESFGRGVLPLSFRALKAQDFRWCFAAVQVLRVHLLDLLPGKRRAGNAMSGSQRLAYLTGALQWYGDLFSLVIFALLMASAFSLRVANGALYGQFSAYLLFLVPMYAAVGMLRAAAVIRHSAKGSWRDAAGALLVWQSLSLTVASASARALFARQGQFRPTPKGPAQERKLNPFRDNPMESVLALSGIAAIALVLAAPRTLSHMLLALLLVPGTMSYGAAPANSVMAARSETDLASRRR
jgi:cellulose synthase/poly-beta-1,6-N-acetylglucosamine synthase-like glycosyltransferase